MKTARLGGACAGWCIPGRVTWSDVTLARRPGRAGEPAVKTLIELPTSPSSRRVAGTSSHRQAVRAGQWRFSTIASYTVEERTALFELARSFDEMPRRGRQLGADRVRRARAGR